MKSIICIRLWQAQPEPLLHVNPSGRCGYAARFTHHNRCQSLAAQLDGTILVCSNSSIGSLSLHAASSSSCRLSLILRNVAVLPIGVT